LILGLHHGLFILHLFVLLHYNVFSFSMLFIVANQLQNRFTLFQKNSKAFLFDPKAFYLRRCWVILGNHQVDLVNLPHRAVNTLSLYFQFLSSSPDISVNFSNSDSLLFAGFYTAFTANTFFCIHRN